MLGFALLSPTYIFSVALGGKIRERVSLLQGEEKPGGRLAGNLVQRDDGRYARTLSPNGEAAMSKAHFPVNIQAPDISPYRQGNTGVDYVTTLDSGNTGPHAMLSAVVH